MGGLSSLRAVDMGEMEVEEIKGCPGAAHLGKVLGMVPAKRGRSKDWRQHGEGCCDKCV